MTISELQRTTDVVVVGHRDGFGRSVLWRTPGVGKDVEAVRQAAVLPAGRRFAAEPGWLLRKLPSGRWLLLLGGAQHPDLRDAFGRGGIFHGVGWIASAPDAAVLLAHDDVPGLTLQLAAVALEGRGRRASRLDAGAVTPLTIASGDLPKETRLAGSTWPALRDHLRRHGLHPVAAPIESASGPAAVPGQTITADPAGAAGAFSIDGSLEAARRILAAWSAGDPESVLF